MLRATNYLTKLYDEPKGWTLAALRTRAAGLSSGKKSLFDDAKRKLVDEAKKMNIRGRGGAGFPMGVKWSFMKPHATKPAYLVINADEGEPGTHKDRTLMELNPHACIEGCIIGLLRDSARTSRTSTFATSCISRRHASTTAIDAAREKGYLGRDAVRLGLPGRGVRAFSGAGAYICGEETSLLNSLEGRRGEPRLKPPFPAQSGAFCVSDDG